MMKMVSVVLVIFMLAVFGFHISWAQCGGDESSTASSDSESGWGEVQGMDSEMDVQPGNSTSSIEEMGMDVQSGDSIDPEGTGAH